MSKFNQTIFLSCLTLSLSAQAVTPTAGAYNATGQSTLADVTAAMNNPVANMPNQPTNGISSIDPDCNPNIVAQANKHLEDAIKDEKDTAEQAKAQRDKLTQCLGGLNISVALGLPSLSGLLDAACAAARKELAPIKQRLQIGGNVRLPGGVTLGGGVTNGNNTVSAPTVTSTGNRAGMIK